MGFLWDLVQQSQISSQQQHSATLEQRDHIACQRGRRRRLVSSHIDPASENAMERLAALIKLRHAARAGCRTRIACIDRRAAGQERVRHRRPAMIGQRPQSWID